MQGQAWPPSANFEWIMTAWTRQEAGRFLDVLVGRGFLPPRDKNDPAAFARAHSAWRHTYVDDLGLEGSAWKRVDLNPSGENIGSWLLGGYQGWLRHRPEGADRTRFNDVLKSVAKVNPAEHMASLLEHLSYELRDVLGNGRTALFLLRSGNELAVMEGTHRVAALALAQAKSRPLPETVVTYQCAVPAETFERFVRSRPTATA